MTDRFVSHAQNGEDVVLWRALGHIKGGVYVDVGANDPYHDSVSRSFYDNGWSGVAIEPNPAFATLYRRQRPRDTVVEVVVTDAVEKEITLHMIHDTGLSTIIDDIGIDHERSGYAVTDVVVAARRLDSVIEAAGLRDKQIHFMSIDTEGAEAAVLRSVDLSKYRPWVLIVEATAPRTTRRTHQDWEPALLESGYTFCFFDGLSRFYVADERREELLDKLDYPTCVFDDFITSAELGRELEMQRLHNAVKNEAERADQASAELVRLHQTVSWRLTSYLRSARRLFTRQQG